MIDTVKLIVPFDTRPIWVAQFRKVNTLDLTTGVSRTNINPSASYKMAGIYLPRLTYIERPGKAARTYKLAIELSLPKLLYGNNFSEVMESDLPRIVFKLSERISSIYNIQLDKDALTHAVVGRIDYCKNIVFDDFTPVISIVNSMRTADISKTYDIQKTDFKNGGHIWHIHTNSLDVAMYDKVADLKQERISAKRSHESDGYSQMYLLDSLATRKTVTVARYEVRLNSVRMIRAELSSLSVDAEIQFASLFTTALARKVLLKHWNNVFNKIPKALMDDESPEQLLLNITKQSPTIKAREALAIMGMRLLADGKEERYVRNLMEGLFSPAQYRRLKVKSREPPGSNQLKALVKISEAITEMRTVSIDDYC